MPPRKKSGPQSHDMPDTPGIPEELGSSDTGTMVLSGPTFTGKQLTYAKVGELAIFEGDIVLGRHAELASPGDGLTGAEADGIAFAVAVSVSATTMRWPAATVPYQIDTGLPDQFRVTDAIAHWVANTPIRFVPRTSANAGTYPNYVRFFAGGGCYSTVGMVGGRQDISLGAGCSTGNAIHEIGHTLGLWHEQSREDRNSFVTINFANVDPAMIHNFDQHISDGDDIGGYDYGSIMHYGATAFTVNGQPTIVPLQAGAVIGQRTGLSAGDIAAIRQMYPTPVSPFKKLRDDGTVVKQVTDGHGAVLKQLVDQQQSFKKIRDDVHLPKHLIDQQKGFDVPFPGPGPLVVNPGVVHPGVVTGGVGGGDLPFILANPHHAQSAAAYAGGSGAVPTGQVDPTTALIASAAQSAAAAARSLAEVAAALGALVGDGQVG